MVYGKKVSLFSVQHHMTSRFLDRRWIDINLYNAHINSWQTKSKRSNLAHVPVPKQLTKILVLWLKQTEVEKALELFYFGYIIILYF